jgi:hypothetical protein
VGCEAPLLGAVTTGGGAFFGGGVLAQPANAKLLAAANTQFEMCMSIAPEFESDNATSRTVHPC